MKKVKNREIEEEIVFCVEELPDQKVRLDSYLIKKFHDYSRSYFEKLISSGLITINEKRVKKSFVVKKGDQVRICFPVPPSFDVLPQDVPFDIIDEQEDFLVINKPAGLTVHHTKKESADPTLVSGLLYRFKEFHEFEDEERPGIVHRIDKNTSGLLIVARNMFAHTELSRMFKERLMNKTYLAVVKGHPDKEGRIDFPIGRHPVERNKMSHVSYAGKPALTFYKVLEYYEDAALVEVKIVTGRTHQIRVHFAAIGHGLLGDPMYGVKSKLISRQALHAWKLSFEYKGKKFEYCCPEPEDFARLLKILRKTLIESEVS